MFALSVSPSDFNAISYVSFSCRIRGSVSRAEPNQVVFSIVQCKKNPAIVLLDHGMLNITFSCIILRLIGQFWNQLYCNGPVLIKPVILNERVTEFSCVLASAVLLMTRALVRTVRP